ncbi:MAG: hypothetical protein M0R66_01135 [Candidatus Omnitrophica bacterium]|nr:hypothetical protein [Candidatus Omnitrophota bacterium]
MGRNKDAAKERDDYRELYRQLVKTTSEERKQLEAENVKLREQLEGWKKLRKLVISDLTGLWMDAVSCANLKTGKQLAEDLVLKWEKGGV